ncbi:WD repeat domain 21 isoform X1 [Stegostoma tigrinum]|uniref:WD repeat domain 21 isoform X1 n=1 Tax=Stegostoma tigrinum TaxID=3053191 RepID=UPI0028701465|nr:WD repeat domain 21 isoform X1 [Stegostoma tigrinum]
MRRNKWHGSHQYGWRDSQRRHYPRRYRGHNRHTSREWNHRADPDASESGLNEQNNLAAESTSNTSVSPDVPELPGFYYDRKKDRYFRLLPGHNNCNPLTWESIRKMEMEEKRLETLEADAKAKQPVVRMGLNLTRLLQKRDSGLMKPAACSRFIQELKVGGMKKNKLDTRSLDSSIQSSFQMILADTNVERIFAAITDKAGYKYGILNLDGHGRESQLISVDMCDNLYSTHRKGTAACWASLSGRDSHVLLCLSGNADMPGCISLLPASIFRNSNSDHLSMLCNFRSSTVWTCAWCFNPQADKCFSTGVLYRVFVTDAVTGQKQIFNTNSSVLAQQFARRAPVLYNGCRSGEIFSLDIRQRMTKALSWAGTVISQNSAVTSIRLLQDENYLMAADMIGKIKLWDLRTTRCVKQYEGHHNECAYLPIYPHEEEGILLAVGQDCYTRIWSLRDGTILRTIPSPHSISKDSIPSIVFSSQLGGRGGVPGLLMAVCHDLYHFPYSSNN